MTLATFDVMDTVLTRHVGTPSAVFLLLGYRLADAGTITCSPEVFARLRSEAESRARLNSAVQEITLAGIYSELAVAMRLTDCQREAIRESELEIESQQIGPVPGAAEMIADARRRYGRVVFVSDMYLPADFLRERLAEHGLFRKEDNDRLYVSSEFGRTKKLGDLYRLMLQRERLPASSVLHHGDHATSDDVAARKVGCQVRPVRTCDLNRYERVLEEYRWSTGGFSSLLAGASRLARLTPPHDNYGSQAIREVAAGVVAPILIGYMMWVLRQAQASGLKRLYFVSRDGQVMLKVAERLAAKLNVAVELRYLYGSRQAWHLPSVTEVDEQVLNWLTVTGHEQVSIRDVLKRVDLEPEGVERCLASSGIARTDWDVPIRSRLRRRIDEALQQPEMQSRIVENAAARRPLVLRYLTQEGLTADDDWALVDIGWRGRVQTSLARILETQGYGSTRAFYFGLFARCEPLEGSWSHAYFFDQALKAGYADAIPHLTAVMEMFCSGDHGQVTGYSEDDAGRVRPVMTERRNHRLEAWGLKSFQESVAKATHYTMADRHQLDQIIDLRSVSASLLRSFWAAPSPEEAQAWGDFPIHSDQDESHMVTLGSPHEWSDVWYALRHGSPRKAHPWHWTAGAWCRTRIGVRCGLMIAMRIAKLRRRLGRIAKRSLRQQDAQTDVQRAALKSQ